MKQTYKMEGGISFPILVNRAKQLAAKKARRKTKYLVLSDCKDNKRYVTFKRAKQDHDKRLLNGKDDGVQLWREYEKYDHLILTDGGRNVAKKNIKSYYSLDTIGPEHYE